MTNEPIADLIQRWSDAEQGGDVAALDALLSADFAGIGPRGFVLTRQQWLARYQAGDVQNESFMWRDVNVRAYGAVAVAVGIQEQRTFAHGHDASGRFRATLICVRQAERWLIAGWQASGPLVEAPPSRG